MTDPITDMLNRIRNAQAVLHETVSIPFSKLKYEIAKILEKESFIEKIDKKGRTTKKVIEIKLKYGQEDNKKKPVILGLKRVSRPGQRIYSGFKRIRGSKGNYGILIVSTSKGLMTNKNAKRQKLGGEIICEIW